MILIQRSGELVLKYATNTNSQRSPCPLCHSSHIAMSASSPPLPSKRSSESIPLHGNKQRGRLRVQLSPEAKQLERSHAIQKVKASLITRTTSSMTTTANQRAAQRASVLAAIGKKDTVISIASPSLSRAERYLNAAPRRRKR